MVRGANRKQLAAMRSVERRVWTSAAILALGGMLFGYDTGVVSGALLYIRKNFGGLSSFRQELVTSMLLVGAAAGAFAAGRIADRIGRKKTLMISVLLFIAGVLLAAECPTYILLLVGRVTVGLAIGSISTVVPLYIGELAPTRQRGALVSLNQLALSIGILTAYLVDYGLSGSGDWRLMFGLAVVPSVGLLAGILFLRESPHWLIRQGREDEARAALARVRTPSEIEPEIAAVHAVSMRQQAGARATLSSAVRPLLVLGVLLAVFQQVTGINSVLYYAPSLLHGAGFGHSDALLANVVNGVVSVGMTGLAIWLLDRVGRRPLLITGTAGMAAGMAITALSFLAGRQLTGTLAIVALAGLVIYTGSFAVGMGPVFWLLIAEIYPLTVRGAAMSVATLANWAANFVVTISFLTLVGAFGGHWVFFLFAFLTLVALAYFYRAVPETKGRSLEDIERGLAAAS